MNIAETIYQHVKAMPIAKAIEVLHFVEFLETKPDSVVTNASVETTCLSLLHCCQ
ncbi:MAG: hypothetical protein PHD43_00845 [Methylococcales bacterium]|nr:hypothetical protein [Methylococcales bacterium]